MHHHNRFQRTLATHGLVLRRSRPGVLQRCFGCTADAGSSCSGAIDLTPTSFGR